MADLMASSPQEDGTLPSKKWWWALSLLGVLPTLVFGFWMLRSETSEVPRGTPSTDSGPDEGQLGLISPSEEGLALPEAGVATSELAAEELAAAAPSVRKEDFTSLEAEREQNSIDRFEQNALDFDERLLLFEQEQPRIDGSAGGIVSEHILLELSRLSEDIKVTTECTPSICIVELTSERSVGSLLASVASWLRRYPEGAIGDPADPDDDQGMRVSFLREEAPGLKDF